MHLEKHLNVWSYLNGSSSQQQSRRGRELLQLSHQSTVSVLDSVSLVQYDVLPHVSLQVRSVDHADLERGNNNWKAKALAITWLHMLLSDLSSLLFRAMIENHGATGEPLLELIHPIGKCGQRTSNKKRSRCARRSQLGDKRDYLNGFSCMFEILEVKCRRVYIFNEWCWRRILPSPISSAKIPLRPFSHRESNHLRPSTW